MTLLRSRIGKATAVVVSDSIDVVDSIPNFRVAVIADTALITGSKSLLNISKLVNEKVEAVEALFTRRWEAIQLTDKVELYTQTNQIAKYALITDVVGIAEYLDSLPRRLALLEDRVILDGSVWLNVISKAFDDTVVQTDSFF